MTLGVTYLTHALVSDLHDRRYKRGMLRFVVLGDLVPDGLLAARRDDHGRRPATCIDAAAEGTRDLRQPGLMIARRAYKAALGPRPGFFPNRRRSPPPRRRAGPRSTKRDGADRGARELEIAIVHVEADGKPRIEPVAAAK